MTFSLARFCFFVVFLAFTKNVMADTWYVRSDGAPHYSANIANLSWRGLDPKHTCDGKHDAAFPAVGTTNVLGNVSDGQNQPCALSDYRWLYDDQGSYGQLNWIIAGGDTVILDNTQAWRVGWDGDGTNSSSEPWCWGWSGSAYGCFNPTVPAGTAQQHTRILGRNWANCGTASGQPDKTKMSQIFGGHGVGTPLNLTDAQYVDVQCVEITRHSQCIRHGYPAYPSTCNSQVPLDDYDSDGIYTNTGTHDLLLQDLWIHGHTDRGIIGPIGGLVTATRVDISMNGMAGWDFDDGNGTPSVNAVLKMSNSTIEWSGCNQEYPAVSTIPVSSCYSQSTGGYGDGIGTPANDGMDVYIDRSVFRYNTQDGEDFGHIDTGSHTFELTNSLSYANNGGQFKWGPNFTSVNFANNIAVGNCLRMSQPIPGTPSSFNAHLGDYCRALDAVSFNFRQGGKALFANNTIVSYAPTTFDLTCVDSSCSDSVFTIKNNLVHGYDNPMTYNMGGRTGGPGLFCGAGCNGSSAAIGTIVRDRNLWYGIRGGCPANLLSAADSGSATNETCNDPSFVNQPTNTMSAESDLDGFTFTLADGSAAIGAGASVPGLSTDYTGAAWQMPPSVGALEYGSKASLISSDIPPVSAPAPPAPPERPSGPVATATSLTADPTESFSGNTTLTINVRAASGSSVPNGTATLYYGTYVITTVALDGSGSANLNYPAAILKLGVTAVYSGNSAFLASSSDVLTSKLLAGSFK